MHSQQMRLPSFGLREDFGHTISECPQALSQIAHHTISMQSCYVLKTRGRRERHQAYFKALTTRTGNGACLLDEADVITRDSAFSTEVVKPNSLEGDQIGSVAKLLFASNPPVDSATEIYPLVEGPRG